MHITWEEREKAEIETVRVPVICIYRTFLSLKYAMHSTLIHYFFSTSFAAWLPVASSVFLPLPEWPPEALG